MSRKLFYVLFGILLYVTVFSVETWAVRNLTYSVGATVGGAYTYHVAEANVINKNVPDVNVIVRGGGGVLNVRRLVKHEVDVGTIDIKLAWEAMKAKGPFQKDPPAPDLRLLLTTMCNGYQFVVLKDSGIKTIYDLEGKEFNPGLLGGTTETVAMDIFTTLGVKPKLRHMNNNDAVEAVKNGTLVGWVQTVVPAALVMDVASVKKIHIISFSDKDMEKITKIVGLRWAKYPAGIYSGVEAFQTVDNEWADFTMKDFPEELAYKWVKTVYEHKAELKQINPGFLGDKFVEITTSAQACYLHPGAIKFYREIGIKIPERLIPPEMK